jgi:hypothetical protein
VQKADAVWTAIAKGSGENVLNIEPSVRPPGTVLLTAPLGPLKDYRNFYFRSVFVPVVIMALAVFIASVGVTGHIWESALLAMLAASMSMFWQFEYGNSLQASELFDYSWGYVDTFLASLGALAMANLLMASLRYERTWIVPALIALALLPLIKPTGFLVGGIVAIAWLAVAVRFAALHPKGLVRGWTGIVGTAIAIVLVLGGVALACFKSNYFSSTNIEFGKVALAQLRSDRFRSDTANGFVALFTGSIGKPVLMAATSMAVVAALRRKKAIDAELKAKANWIASIGLVVIFAGVIFTYQATLFRQVRYFFPVIAVATVLFAPILVDWSKRAGKLVCTGLAIIPISLLIFLASPRLNGLSNSLASYRLFTGSGRVEAKAADAFIDEFRMSNANIPVLFTTSNGVGAYYFEAAFVRRLRAIGFSEPRVIESITRPLNWGKEGFPVKIDPIYNADIIAIEPHSMIRADSKTMTSTEESVEVKAWLATTPSTGSTEVLLETQSLLVLVVRDRRALEVQMRKFIASRHWRPEFISSNARKEFGQAEVSKLHLGKLQLANPVDFSHIVRVHALSITRVASEPKISISIFSELLGKDHASKYAFFIHQLNGKGEIISVHSVPLRSSRFAERPLIRDLYSVDLNPKTVHLGVGIFESTRGALVTGWPLATDWGGRRAKFNINKLPTTTPSEVNP